MVGTQALSLTPLVASRCFSATMGIDTRAAISRQPSQRCYSGRCDEKRSRNTQVRAIVFQVVESNPGSTFEELCELLPDADTNDILAAGAPI